MRPELEMEGLPEEKLTVDNTEEEKPEESTVPWPPPPVGSDVQPINEVVRITMKTSLGDIDIALDGTRAPLTVGNFAALAKKDFYDGTAFHRVIPDFMIQGGDPLAKDQANRAMQGTGGPGYTFKDEINANSYGLDKIKVAQVLPPQALQQLPEELLNATMKEYYQAQGYEYTEDVESLPMRRGTVAMANSGPNTNGSQFFIIVAEEVPQLLGKHTPFGVVEKGMDVVDKIVAVERDAKDNPLEPVVIEDIVVYGEGLLRGLEVEE